MDNGVRLNKFLAQQLNLGRRAVDELITKGAIKVNGELPTLGARMTLGDKVEIRGKVITAAPQTFIYLLMDKPTGYVCSRRQQGDTPTIYSLLPQKYQHLKTVGRLDKNSSGLILLTNDGDLAHRLTHPSFKKIKKYEITLDRPLEPLHMQMIADYGVDLPDGKSRLQLDRIGEGNAEWQITMHEGRNRQIRRTFAALGYEITHLHRIQFGPFIISQLGNHKLKQLDTLKLEQNL